MNLLALLALMARILTPFRIPATFYSLMLFIQIENFFNEICIKNTSLQHKKSSPTKSPKYLSVTILKKFYHK